jgi:hypothetical protein
LYQDKESNILPLAIKESKEKNLEEQKNRAEGEHSQRNN